MKTDYKKLALESLKFIRKISDNEAFCSSVDGTEIDIDNNIKELEFNVPNMLEKLKKEIELNNESTKLLKENMKTIIIHLIKEKWVDAMFIDDLDVVNSDKGIKTGEYIDSVTKILPNGKYFYTHDGERSNEIEVDGIEELPIESLSKIIKLLQD